MLSYLTMIRPLNCLMTIIAVFIGGLLVSDIQTLIFTPTIYVAMFAAAVIMGAGNVINDYVDVESDKVNAQNRPIAAGKASRKGALGFAIVLFLIGIISTIYVGNVYMFIIAVVNSILLVLYSYNLQNKILLGNLVVSYLVGSTFLFGGAAFGNMILPLLLMLLATLANISREIVKDLEDLEGDRKGFLKRLVSGVKKIAERFEVVDGKTKLKYGKKKATITAQLSLVGAIIVSPIPYIIGILGLSYLALATLTDLVFLLCILKLFKASKKQHYKKISNKIKLGMLIGLIAFIVGILF